MFNSIQAISLDKVTRVKPEFVLKSFMPIPKHTVAMLASSGGVGKTNMSIQCAAKFVEETNSNVLVWFSEDEAGVIGIRFDYMAKHGLLNKATESRISYILTEPKQFATVENKTFKANYSAILDLREDCIRNDIKFIIIDPLLAFYGGEENNNSQARIFMQPFLEWAKQDGVTILFIHHASKGSNGSTRGAGAFVDAVRTLYELDYIRDDKDEIDFDKKDSGLRRITLRKDNRGAYEYFEKVYGGGDGEVRVIPRRVTYEEHEYKEIPSYDKVEAVAI